MFLTRGPMPHEGLWGAWLRAANGLVPGESQDYDILADQAQCNRNKRGGPFLHSIQQRPGDVHSARPCQCLFSIYIHPPPGHADYPNNSVFHGREVPQIERIQVPSIATLLSIASLQGWIHDKLAYSLFTHLAVTLIEAKTVSSFVAKYETLK